MKSELRKALYGSFRLAMSRALPSFVEEKVPGAGGDLVFKCIPGVRVHVFVILVPDPKGRDCFTVEVGWSKLGRFPELPTRPSVRFPTKECEEWELEEYICRLPRIVDRSGDPWWCVRADIAMEGKSPAEIVAELARRAAKISAEEAKNIVTPPVLAAEEFLTSVAVPYLSAFLQKMGMVLGPCG